MAQDIYNRHGGTTGNILHGIITVKTPGKGSFNTQTKDLGHEHISSDEKAVVKIQSKYSGVTADQSYYSQNKLLGVNGLKGYFTTTEPGRLTQSGSAFDRTTQYATIWTDSIGGFTVSQVRTPNCPTVELGGLKKSVKNLEFDVSNDYLLKNYTDVGPTPDYNEWLPGANESAMYVTVFRPLSFNQNNSAVWVLGGGNKQPNNGGFRGASLQFYESTKKLNFRGKTDTNITKTNTISGVGTLIGKTIVHIGVRNLSQTGMYQWANDRRSTTNEIPAVPTGDNFKYVAGTGGLCIGSIQKASFESFTPNMKFSLMAAYVRDTDFTVKEINKLGKSLASDYNVSWQEITDITVTE